MPLTFPAHQVPALVAKLVRPRWFDGTTLVVAAAAPDLNAAFAPYDSAFRSHGIEGLVFFSIPFSIVYSMILRRWCADGLFGALPDLGPLRVHNYRVLGDRPPAFWITALSAVLGAGSHIFIDSFTHTGRWGADFLGLNTFLFDSPRGEFTTARLLQYLGHTVGTLTGAALFMLIASSGHMQRWYGHEVVAQARARPRHPQAGRIVAAAVLLGQLPALAWMTLVTAQAGIFMMGLCFTVSLLVGGFLARYRD